MQTVQISEIVVGNNPRKFFDPAEMEELTASIREKGVIQPILVRPLLDGGYQVVAGGRRYAAAKAAHGDDYPMPVVIKDLDDDEAEELALIENVQRADMSPAEEAEAAAKILARSEGDRDDAARRLGWSRATLDKRLGLMNATDAVRSALAERRIKLGHAELLAGLPRPKQDAVLGALLKAPELVGVGEFKQQIQKLANALSTAVFDKTECAQCPHSSGNQQALFGEAVEDGHCTNRECWDGKTEAALDEIRKGLIEDFPEVRIVRPGENFTVIKLVAEGGSGVGDVQAQACRSCGKFGAAISAVPGKVGKVFKDLCFDSACNAEKVKANHQAIVAAAQPAQPAAPTPGATTTGSASNTSPAAKPVTQKKAAEVQDSTRVKEYRAKVWRSALAKHLYMNPEVGERVLLALCMSGDARHISATQLGKAFAKLTQGSSPSLSLTVALTQVGEASDEVVSKLKVMLPAATAEGLEEHKVVALLNELKVNLADHWTLNADYLGLLTKSESKVVAEQIGLAAHMGKDLDKALGEKKDECVKKLLAVSGFDYAGKLPANVMWKA